MVGGYRCYCHRHTASRVAGSADRSRIEADLADLTDLALPVKQTVRVWWVRRNTGRGKATCVAGVGWRLQVTALWVVVSSCVASATKLEGGRLEAAGADGREEGTTSSPSTSTRCTLHAAHQLQLTGLPPPQRVGGGLLTAAFFSAVNLQLECTMRSVQGKTASVVTAGICWADESNAAAVGPR